VNEGERWRKRERKRVRSAGGVDRRGKGRQEGTVLGLGLTEGGEEEGWVGYPPSFVCLFDPIRLFTVTV